MDSCSINVQINLYTQQAQLSYRCVQCEHDWYQDTCTTDRAKWKGYLSNSIVRIKASKKLQKSWSPAFNTTMFQLILLPWQVLRLHKPQQIQEQTSGHRVCTSDSLAFSFSSSLPAYSSSFQSMEDIYCC